MTFQPRSGCPMCSIVNSQSHSPVFPASARPDILWRDDNVTVYREKAHPVSSKGHLIVALNVHAPSIYSLSSSDLPLLVNIRNIALRLLTSLAAPSSAPSSPNISTGTNYSFLSPPPDMVSKFRIGFITPPFKDTKIPITDHLHAHAYIAPADLLGWWRGVAYGPLAWYPIDDLIAEIRESVSNNRVKSGYDHRYNAPIDTVPTAGSRSGTADGREVVHDPLARPSLDIEGGLSPDLPIPPSPGGVPPSPTTSVPGPSRSPSIDPQSSIPSLTV